MLKTLISEKWYKEMGKLTRKLTHEILNNPAIPLLFSLFK